MENKILEMLLEKYSWKKANFISNDNIIDFFENNIKIIQYNDFIEIREYFQSILGVKRSAFKTIEAWFKTETDKKALLTETDSLSEKPLQLPRNYKKLEEAIRDSVSMM